MSFFGPGGTGRNIAGLLGDVFLQQGGMQPIYGPSVKQRQLMQLEEQQRQRDWADWEKKEKYKRANQAPDIPELAKTVGYYRSIGRNDIADDLENKARMVTIQQADPSGEVRTLYERPTSLMSGGAQPAAPTTDLPRISTPAEAAKLPPGSWFIAPDGSRRQVPGGAGSGAPRPFR